MHTDYVRVSQWVAQKPHGHTERVQRSMAKSRVSTIHARQQRPRPALLGLARHMLTRRWSMLPRRAPYGTSVAAGVVLEQPHTIGVYRPRRLTTTGDFSAAKVSQCDADGITYASGAAAKSNLPSETIHQDRYRM